MLRGSNGGSKWGTQSQYLTPKKFFPVFGLWRPGLFELRDGTYTIGKLRVSAFQCSHFLASEVVWRPIFRDFFLQFLTFFCHLIKLKCPFDPGSLRGRLLWGHPKGYSRALSSNPASDLTSAASNGLEIEFFPSIFVIFCHLINLKCPDGPCSLRGRYLWGHPKIAEVKGYLLV